MIRFSTLEDFGKVFEERDCIWCCVLVVAEA